MTRLSQIVGWATVAVFAPFLTAAGQDAVAIRVYGLEGQRRRWWKPCAVSMLEAGPTWSSLLVRRLDGRKRQRKMPTCSTAARRT